MQSDLKPPRTVYHGTDSAFDKFDIDLSLGAHFGTRQAAHDRLKSTDRLKIEYQSYPNDGEWFVREQNWSNRPAFEHGPFDNEDAADCFILTAPAQRTPLEFEIDVYRPLLLEDLGVWTFEAAFTHLAKHFRNEIGNMDDIWSEWNQSSIKGWAAMKSAIKSAGYDCIAYRNETEDPGSISWIVMDADKIHPKWRPGSPDVQEIVDRPRMRA